MNRRPNPAQGQRPGPAPGVVPVRIQRRRSKGWRMPPGAKYVGRPTRWGNPWTLADHGAAALTLYRAHARALHRAGRSFLDELREFEALACWCRPGDPCHVDVLIELLQEAP